MKLSDVIDNVLVDSGQFIVGDLEDLCLDKDKFWIMVKTILNTYEMHRPFTWHDTVKIDKKHRFFEKVNDEYAEPEDQYVTRYVPEWVSEVLPIGVGNVFNNQFVLNAALQSNSSWAGDTQLEPEPMSWVWRYEKPYLYVPYNGTLDVLCVGKHVTIKEMSTSGTLKDVTIVDLEADKMLMDMVLGKFMQAVGRSRRAFSLDDIPVTSDSDTLVSEGKEIYDTAYEQLENRNKWHLAIGN